MKLIYRDNSTTYVKGAFIALRYHSGRLRLRLVVIRHADEFHVSYIFGRDAGETIILHSMYSYATGLICEQ